MSWWAKCPNPDPNDFEVQQNSFNYAMENEYYT